MSSETVISGVTMELDNGQAFDAIVHGSGIPECGDLRIATKARATEDGRPLVAIGFSVKLPSGEIRQVQHVTTARLFVAIADSIRTKHSLL